MSEHFSKYPRIGVVAPSGVVNEIRLDAGLALLKAGHFSVDCLGQIHAKDGYLAGDDTARKGAFDAALSGPCDVIWAARGGYGAVRLLAKLGAGWRPDQEKMLVGFSDVTALHALWMQARFPAIHGANISTLPDWSPEAREELYGLVRREIDESVYPGHFVGAGAPGQASGFVLTANLTVLASLVGTPWMPNLGGAILVLEDVGESPYRLDRNFQQLRHSGAFEGVEGFALGDFKDCEPSRDELPGGELMVELLSALGKPILKGLQIGHHSESRAIRQGVWGHLDGRAHRLVVYNEDDSF
ncbi:MAG: LD-carboxypeptidase [Myxococcota bacterium]|nr:LD-carboxypeptidase [Myxococcota bacterium]